MGSTEPTRTKAKPRQSENFHPASDRGSSSGSQLLALPASLAVAIGALALVPANPILRRSFLGAAAVLLVWCLALALSVHRSRRQLELQFAPRMQHWLQGLTQGTLIVYWAVHNPLVFGFFPFYFVQLLFAYAVDSLLNWSRRDTYSLGFGAFPIILSINLFLLFKPEWFYWQFVLIALGYTAKELIHWQREGRSTHIFNPSSFPLAVFSLVLLITGTTETTFGNTIANTIADTPHIYLAIFLIALPVQIRFGVSRVTLWAALTMYVVGLAYLAATGTYLFYDAHIPPAVFIGMTLLVTDPSTSPRTEVGRFAFGAIYGVSTMVLFILLERIHAPTFYDKLLPIPIMNLLVRGIDGVVRKSPLATLAPERIGRWLSPMRRNLAVTALWAAVFGGMYAVQGVGDTHPGQYVPFWHNACAAGSARACSYTATLTVVLCRKGSGWACNETGILERRLGQSSAASFRRACDLGFQYGCENLTKPESDRVSYASGPPELRDLPIVLNGSKPPLRERDPAKLYAMACEQGWPGACGGWASEAVR